MVFVSGQNGEPPAVSTSVRTPSHAYIERHRPVRSSRSVKDQVETPVNTTPGSLEYFPVSAFHDHNESAIADSSADWPDERSSSPTPDINTAAPAKTTWKTVPSMQPGAHLLRDTKSEPRRCEPEVKSNSPHSRSRLDYSRAVIRDEDIGPVPTSTLRATSKLSYKVDLESTMDAIDAARIKKRDDLVNNGYPIGPATRFVGNMSIKNAQELMRSRVRGIKKGREVNYQRLALYPANSPNKNWVMFDPAHDPVPTDMSGEWLLQFLMTAFWSPSRYRYLEYNLKSHAVRNKGKAIDLFRGRKVVYTPDGPRLVKETQYVEDTEADSGSDISELTQFESEEEGLVNLARDVTSGSTFDLPAGKAVTSVESIEAVGGAMIKLEYASKSGHAHSQLHTSEGTGREGHKNIDATSMKDGAMDDTA